MNGQDARHARPMFRGLSTAVARGVPWADRLVEIRCPTARIRDGGRGRLLMVLKRSGGCTVPAGLPSPDGTIWWAWCPCDVAEHPLSWGRLDEVRRAAQGARPRPVQRDPHDVAPAV